MQDQDRRSTQNNTITPIAFQMRLHFMCHPSNGDDYPVFVLPEIAPIVVADVSVTPGALASLLRLTTLSVGRCKYKIYKKFSFIYEM